VSRFAMGRFDMLVADVQRLKRQYQTVFEIPVQDLERRLYDLEGELILGYSFDGICFSTGMSGYSRMITR